MDRYSGSGSAGTTGGDAPVREAFVSRQITVLLQRVDRMGELVNAIEERLSVVLSPAPGAPKDGAWLAAAPQVPLANILADANGRLMAMTERAESLLSRIEL